MHRELGETKAITCFSSFLVKETQHWLRLFISDYSKIEHDSRTISHAFPMGFETDFDTQWQLVGRKVVL